MYLQAFVVSNENPTDIVNHSSSLLCNASFFGGEGGASGRFQDFSLLILAFIILVMAVSKRIFLCVTLSWDLLNFLQVYAFCHVESFVGCHSCLQIFFLSFAFSLLIGIQLHTCYTSCPSSAWGSVHFLKYIFLCKYWQISMYISLSFT